MVLYAIILIELVERESPERPLSASRHSEDVALAEASLENVEDLVADEKPMDQPAAEFQMILRQIAANRQ